MEHGINILLQRHQSPSFVREVEEIEGTSAHIKISMAFEPGIVRLSALSRMKYVNGQINFLPAPLPSPSLSLRSQSGDPGSRA